MPQRPPRYDLPRAAPAGLRLVQQFLNTTDHEKRELLGTPRALRGWLTDQGLNDPGPLGPAALRRARVVREALHRFAVTGEFDRTLEEAARRARLTVSLEPAELVALAPGVDGALGRILAVVYDAMRDGSWSRLKMCRNCGWAFWDGSRNRSATWCSMQLCGNRLKVRRHRAKITPRSSR
jgi:CGNR zinc finger/Putative stress-induced transcription regulator